MRRPPKNETMELRYTTIALLFLTITAQAQVFDWAGQMGYNGN